MNTAEHITLAKPAAWCTSGSPGGATYGVSSSSAFARAISAAGFGGGSGAESADLVAPVCCVWAPVTKLANKNAATNARMRYVSPGFRALVRREAQLGGPLHIKRDETMDESR